LLGRGKSPEKSERFEAIAHFVPIYSLRKGKMNKIFAGGPHSFAICSSPAQFEKIEMKVNKIELVYTDSSVLHRFIRVSLPKNKQLFDRIWAKIQTLPGKAQIDSDIELQHRDTVDSELLSIG
jgi:hypothetical protein